MLYYIFWPLKNKKNGFPRKKKKNQTSQHSYSNTYFLNIPTRSQTIVLQIFTFQNLSFQQASPNQAQPRVNLITHFPPSVHWTPLNTSLYFSYPPSSPPQNCVEGKKRKENLLPPLDVKGLVVPIFLGPNDVDMA